MKTRKNNFVKKQNQQLILFAYRHSNVKMKPIQIFLAIMLLSVAIEVIAFKTSFKPQTIGFDEARRLHAHYNTI